MKLDLTINIIELICIIIILIGVLLFIYAQNRAKKNNNYPYKSSDSHNYAVLIPARYESKVIEGLLKSILEQSMKINMEDVYVVVEDINDPTVEICKKYKCSFFVRKHLELKKKGYALDEVIKDILSKNKKYDAYFIFDADNVLDKDYFLNMTKTFDQGYDIGIGYRNCKNGNLSMIAACSALTFSMVNTLSNESKKQRTNTMTISGTGFYIRGEFIDLWGGYPFNTLTEDYELSLYANLHALTTDYNKEASFYDEQPTIYKQTVKQRIRWIRGYVDSRKKYIPLIREEAKKKTNNYGSNILEIVGVKPYVFIVIGIFIFLVYQLYMLISQVITKEISWLIPIRKTFDILVIAYFIMVIITAMMILLENKKLNLNRKMKIKVLFFNPLYLVTYVPCALMAVLKKEVTWDRIDHNSVKVDN